MAGTGWRGNRLALAAAGLALLAGTPAVLTAAKVKNPWILAAATATAAVIVVFSAMRQQRYQRQVQRRDEQDLRVQDGCLVRADGRLPLVQDITDPVLAGVHRAQAPAAVPPAGGEREAGAPAYIPRDADTELRERLAAGGFVLLIGDSTAGKTRAAFEAIRGPLADHVLISPAAREAVAAAVGAAARELRCVLWLDDLETYLGAGGLTGAQAGRLLAGPGHHRVIVAAIRAFELDRITGQAQAEDEAGRQATRDLRQVLDLAHQIRIGRMFSPAELDRARARTWDRRIADALDQAGSYGIAEYLTAGPTLLQTWENARSSSHGPHVRGAALVAAAIDIRRAGWTSLLPRDLLTQTHEHYLTDPEHARTPHEPLDEAWDWATRQREATTALLRPDPADPGQVKAFDYLIDSIQRRDGPLAHIPEPTIRAAISHATAAEADSIAYIAYDQGRYQLAERGWRRALSLQATDLGAEHPTALSSRSNLALVLHDRGRLDEAEAEARAVLDMRARVLGADHPDTLTSRSNLALVLRDRGRLDEAEAEARAALDGRTRVLGADHPHTLTSRSNLAHVLRDRGRLDEAEAEARAALDGRTRVLGADHPDTLTSRSNLALVLHDRGRLAEAGAEHRTNQAGPPPG